MARDEAALDILGLRRMLRPILTPADHLARGGGSFYLKWIRKWLNPP